MVAMSAAVDELVGQFADSVRQVVREEVSTVFAEERARQSVMVEAADNGRKVRGNLVNDEERAKARSALAHPLVLPGIKEGQGLIDAKTLARFLDVSHRFLYRLISVGGLPAAVTLGRSKRWQLEEIMAWVFHGCPTEDKWRPIRSRAMREYREAIRQWA